jgi:hypothetical protein
MNAKLSLAVIYGLPKVSSSYSLSPRRGGERVRVRGDRKELLPIAINGVAKLSLGTRKTIFQ